MLGVPQATIGRWLCGERTPQAVFLARIESTFGVSASLWGVPPFSDDEPKTAKAA